MPTPYGYRGGMAFSADELRVLRGALAVALQSGPASAPGTREVLRLAEHLDEAEHEGHRLRTFLVADLARYRAALPGAAAGYLERLEDALAAGWTPAPEDLAALRRLRAGSAGAAEAERRAELLRRCESAAGVAPAGASRGAAAQGGPARPVFLPAGRAPVCAERDDEPGRRRPAEPAQEPAQEPEPERKPGPGRERKPAPEPAGEPAREPGPAEEPGKRPERRPGKPSGPEPQRRRPVPTPGEVFPPRRRKQPPQHVLTGLTA
ncbi:hypothetical protein [Streptomyces sp. JJ36]|uniref:hypothetical protein n=1 Tax=Streptomyces sp. JJ36 TaxID=2736645 RepID=UPI001F1FC18C|nr:hypothetical protein [Streptomyces sp. JJ36]MCF6523674.1 hypothetical protein [Streptomyces sp. JJ36]